MKNKYVLIVGGTGSWAKGLIQELLTRGVGKIRILARNKVHMASVIEKFQDSRIEPIIGDIRNDQVFRKACKDVNIVFHLAALKHVPTCETIPVEAIETNIIGTQNVINSAIYEKVDKVIYVSTNKAVNVNCTYGCTKLLGEKLTLSANKKQENTKFIVFRCGNVLGSAGSVIPLFKKQIIENGFVRLTDKRMSRFFISIKRASKLLVDVSLEGMGGEIFLPTMSSIYIKNIAKYLLWENGLSEDNIQVVGIRDGEKLSEQIVTGTELQHIYKLNKDLTLIAPRDYNRWAVNEVIKKLDNYNYTSDENILNFNQTGKFLQSVIG